MDIDSQDLLLSGKAVSETTWTLLSSPCPSRRSTLSSQSSFPSGSAPQTPPRKILNLDENPTPREIVAFSFELFHDELRTKGAKVD